MQTSYFVVLLRDLGSSQPALESVHVRATRRSLADSLPPRGAGLGFCSPCSLWGLGAPARGGDLSGTFTQGSPVPSAATGLGQVPMNSCWVDGWLEEIIRLSCVII